MKTILLYFTLFFGLITSASGQCYNGHIPIVDETWGIGLIHLPPTSSITVYHQETRQKIGEIQSSQEKRLAFIPSINDSRLTALKNYRLQIGDYTNLFLKALYRTNDQKAFKLNIPNGIIYTSDLDKIEGKYYSYKSLLSQQKNLPSVIKANSYLCSVLSVALADQCLQLREAPRNDSKSIICLERHDWQKEPPLMYIKIVSEAKGNWTRVEVQEYLVDPVLAGGDACSLYKNRLFKGWIKFLDDNGSPNIWYYNTSY